MWRPKQVTHVTTLIVIALTGITVTAEAWLLEPNAPEAIAGGLSGAALTFIAGVLMGSALGMPDHFPLWFWRCVCSTAWLLQLLIVMVAAGTKEGGDLKAGTAAFSACFCMMGLFKLLHLKTADEPLSS